MIILKRELYDYYITSQDIEGLPETPSLIRKLVQHSPERSGWERQTQIWLRTWCHSQVFCPEAAVYKCSAEQEQIFLIVFFK